MDDYSTKLRRFLCRMFIPYMPNPGWNMTAIMTLGGFALMGFSFLLQQAGFGVVEPTIIELGKAAFYTGLGRATVPHKVD